MVSLVSSPTILAVLGVYLALLIGIGAWGGRGARGMNAYFLADKKLPAWVIAFSSNSTGESAWLLLGLTGMGYMIGVHALWIVLGEVVGVALAWSLVALPFKAHADRYQSITVADYLEERFRPSGGKGRAFRAMGAVIILSMVTAYTAAQMTAAGKAFSSFLGTTYGSGVLIGAIVILFYTSVGGLKAVAYSDLLQGLLMFGGLLMLPIVGIAAAGGWGEMVGALSETDPALLRPMGSFGIGVEGIISVISFIGIGFAFLGAPQLLVRFMAARGQREIVDGSLIAVICIIVFDIGAVFAGMAGRVLFPGLADPETVLPQMSTELLPAVFTGIFLVVVLAAIMSTADSLLIMASASVVRDVLQQIFRPDLSDRLLAMVGRITTVAIGLVALGLAIGEARVIFWFVLFAWSGLASAFTPVVLCSLFWKGATRAGALAGMLTGFLTSVLWVLLLKEQTYELYEMIPGFLMGFLATVIVSRFTEPPESGASEVEAVLREVNHPFAH